MDTRNVILNAAAEVFAQHGFRGSTTRRIADAAAVNEVTIFRYFGSKDALLEEAIKNSTGQAFSHPLPSTPVDPESELVAWCTEVVAHLHARRSMIRTCMGEMEERPQMTRCAAQGAVGATNELCAYFRQLKTAGFTSDSFDATAAAAMLIGALFHDAMGRDMMPDVYPKPASRAPALYARLVLRAIGVETAPPAPVAAPRRSSGKPDHTLTRNAQ